MHLKVLKNDLRYWRKDFSKTRNDRCFHQEQGYKTEDIVYLSFKEVCEFFHCPTNSSFITRKWYLHFILLLRENWKVYEDV